MLCNTHWNAKPIVQGWLMLVLLVLPAHGMANTPLHAAATAPTTTPAHALLPGSRLWGEASLRYWGLRIYHARLWAMPGVQANQVIDHPLVLELEYQRDLKGAAIADRSLSEMMRGGPIPEPQAQQWLTQMQRIFPDIKTGDKLTGQHQPGQGASFIHNGRHVGRIDDPEFSRRFFGIWLAPTTSEPEMRTTLLGLNPAKNR
jgi:hypothetical protein